MVIEEKLKLNKFREVSIPKASDMFARLGYRNLPDNNYTGDAETFEGRKLDNLREQDEAYRKYAEAKQQEELDKTAEE